MKHSSMAIRLGTALSVLLLGRWSVVAAEQRQPMRSEKLTEHVTKLVYEGGQVELEVSGSPWEYVSAKSGRVKLIVPDPPKLDEPSPRAVDTARGYLTFSPAGRRGVLPGYRPPDSELMDEVSIFASPGEFEPATFAVRPLAELSTVTFEVGDLHGPNGATIPASSVDIYIVEPTVVQMNWLASQHPGKGESVRWVAKWLRPGNTAETAVARNTQVYLDVRIPAEARPGRYSTTIAIQPEKGKASSFTVRLEVLPLGLARPMAWGMFAYNGHFDRRSTLSKPSWLEEMRRAGMTQCVLSAKPRTPKVLPDGRVDCSMYDRYVEAYRKAGFEDPPILSMEGLFADAKPGEVTAEKRQFMGQVIRRIYEHSLKAKWPPYYIYFVDEPGPGTEHMERLKFMCALAREFAPGMQTASTACIGGGDPEDWYKYIPKGLLDLEIAHIHHQWAHPCRGADANRRWRQVAAREDMELYAYSTFISTLDTFWDNRYITFPLEKAGLDGMMPWVQTLGSDEKAPFSPYRFVLTAKNGIYCLFYPDGSVWRSLPWIGLREGIDDSRYVRTVRKLVGNAEAAGKRDAAQKARMRLQRVLAKAPWVVGANSDTGLLRQKWTAVDADAARWELAQAAVACQRALDEDK